MTNLCLYPKGTEERSWKARTLTSTVPTSELNKDSQREN